jgi:hypothetical protein
MVLLLHVVCLLQRCDSHQQEQVDFPPLLDSDDISYFFERNDLDGLYWALSRVFARSARNPNYNNNDETSPELPSSSFPEAEDLPIRQNTSYDWI